MEKQWFSLFLAIVVCCVVTASPGAVTYSNNSVQGDASYLIEAWDEFMQMFDVIDFDHQTIYLSSFPASWSDAANADSWYSSTVYAHATISVAYGAESFSGSLHGDCQADSYDSALAMASTMVNFKFTLDQAYQYTLTSTVERWNDTQVAVVELRDDQFDLVALNDLGTSGVGPQTLVHSGTLAAGQYTFQAQADANYWSGPQNADVSYDMQLTPVPEPVSLAVLASGGLWVLGRRRA